MTERSPMAERPRLLVVRTSPHRRLAEAVAPVGTPLGQDGGPGPEGLREGEEKMSTDQPTEARNAYAAATAQAQKAYEKALAPAQKVYGAATAQAQQAYGAATAPAQKAYDEAKGVAGKAYDEAMAPARKAYDKAMASARRPTTRR